MKDNSCSILHTQEEILRTIRGRDAEGHTGIIIQGPPYHAPIPESMRKMGYTFEQMLGLATGVSGDYRYLRVAMVASTVLPYDVCNKHINLQESMYDMFCLTTPNWDGVTEVALCVIYDAD